MLFNNIEGMATTSTVPSRKKESAPKIQVPCPDVTKMYKNEMGSVDLSDQRATAFHLDRK